MSITTHEAVAALEWTGVDRPTTPRGWVRRAEEVAAILEVDAAEPDRPPAAPHAEVRLLQQTGLVTLLGPVSAGGAGQGWGTAARVVRRVAEGDGSIGRLLGDHYVWSQLPAFLGTAGQADEGIATATREHWFFAGSVPARDADLVAVDTGRDLVFSGRTTFSAGAAVSDVTWLDAAIDGHDARVLALAPSHHPGLAYHDGAHPSGTAPVGGGDVTVTDLVLPWRSALGWVDKRYVGWPDRAAAAPVVELVRTQVSLGIAAGGLRSALTRTREVPRPDPSGPHRSGVDAGEAHGALADLADLADLRSTLGAAQALADEAGDAVELLHLDPAEPEPRDRGEVAVLVAAAERRAIDVGRRVGTRVHGTTRRR